MTMLRMDPESRTSSPYMLLATLALVAIGLAIRAEMAASIPVAAALILAAVAVIAVVPASGVSAVLLALPTIYQLDPMPRGEFTLLELAILAAAAGTGINVLARIRRGGWGDIQSLVTPAHIVVPVGMVLLATGMSMLTLASLDVRSESLREIRTVIVEPLIFLATARIVLRQASARAWTSMTFIFAGVVFAGHGMVQVALDLGGVQAGGVTRATGFYPHPNNLAFLLERTLLFTTAVAIMRPRWWPVWGVAVIQLAGLGMTFSRGAVLGLVAGIAIILLLRGLYKWIIGLAAVGVLAGGAGFVIAPDRLVDVGGSGSEPTRFAIWRASVQMLLDHPVFGVGPDQFLYQYWRRYVEPMGWPERYTSHPHNIILDIWLRLGVFGLAAFGALIAGMVLWVRQRFSAVRGDIWAMGAIAALTGGLVHGLVDNSFFLPDLATMTWFFVAMIMTTTRQPGQHEAEGTEAVGRDEPAHDRMIPEPVGQPAVLLSGAAILAMVAFPPSELLTLGIILAGAVLAWVSPAVMVAIVVATVPIQESVLLPSVGGELTFTQIALIALVLGWGVSFWRHGIWLDAITLWFVAIGGALLVSLVAMDDFGLWSGEVYRWAIASVFFVVCRSVLRDWASIAPVIWAMIISTSLTWIYAWWQLVQSAGPEHMFRGGILRVFATFGTPNTLGAYIELTIPLLVILALLGVRRSFRERIGTRLWVGMWATSIPGLLVLVQTQSRGAMIGFAAAMAVVLLILPVKVRVLTVATGTLLAVVLAFSPAGQSQIQRFADVFDESSVRPASTYDYGTGRSALWGAAVNMIVDKPFTGVGAGEFDHHYREYTPSWLDRFPRGQAHNGWLQMGAQAGVAGFVAFSGWVLASLVSLFGAGRRSVDALPRALAVGALSVMIAFSVHSLVDYLNVLSLGLQLSAVAAMGLALAPEPLQVLREHRPVKSQQGAVPQTGVA